MPRSHNPTRHSCGLLRLPRRPDSYLGEPQGLGTQANIMLKPSVRSRLLFCLLAGTLAAKPINTHAQGGIITVWGIGTASCATAGEPDRTNEANAWTMGFFSAANALNTQDHNVGNSTDAPGVWGEVHLECSAHPSEKFFLAVQDVYFKLEQQGR